MCRANMLQQGGQTETDVWDLKLCSLNSCSLWEMSSSSLTERMGSVLGGADGVCPGVSKGKHG